MVIVLPSEIPKGRSEDTEPGAIAAAFFLR